MKKQAGSSQAEQDVNEKIFGNTHVRCGHYRIVTHSMVHVRYQKRRAKCNRVAFNFFNSTGIMREDKHCVIVRLHLEPIL